MYEITEYQRDKIDKKIDKIFKSQEDKWYSLNFKNGRRNKGREKIVRPTQLQEILINLLNGRTFDKDASFWIVNNLDNDDLIVSTILHC